MQDLADSDSGVISDSSRPPSGVFRGIGLIWLGLSSLAIIAYAVVPYLTASLADLASSNVGLAEEYRDKAPWVQAAFYIHIGGGAIALLASPLQFARGVRSRFPQLHRFVGRIVLVSIGVAGLAALALAPFSPAGLVGLFGFGAMAVLWLTTGLAAYRAIRRRDVPGHSAWMIRNFALTYSAVTLRVWVGVLIFAQVPFASGAFDFDFDAAFWNAYAAVPFLCWLPNLIVAEVLIRRRGLPSFRLVPASETSLAMPAVTCPPCG